MDTINVARTVSTITANITRILLALQQLLLTITSTTLTVLLLAILTSTNTDTITTRVIDTISITAVADTATQ